MKTVNLKEGMPLVHQAMAQLTRELALARQQRENLVKFIHGYGSSGAGGDIRIAVQSQLQQMFQRGEIRGCIFGENWAISDEQTWTLLKAHAELKQDKDLGKKNLGITIVVL
jgi:hypothetical protein